MTQGPQNTPGLAVVMPVLDEAAGIDAALMALAPLMARGVRVVVADGGSADDTPAWRGASAASR